MTESQQEVELAVSSQLRKKIYWWRGVQRLFRSEEEDERQCCLYCNVAYPLLPKVLVYETREMWKMRVAISKMSRQRRKQRIAIKAGLEAAVPSLT